MTAQPSPVFVWSCADYSFQSKRHYANPFQRLNVRATFTAPSGLLHAVDGFWDGDLTWRVRFAPNEVGLWHYVTNCSEHDNEGLHNQQGTFVCQVGATDGNRFQSHGPLRLSASKTYLAHADGTPFFWLADTAWNGPLRASSLTDWHHYLETRVRQGFTAVQWVTTQWRAAPDGDIEGNLAYSGTDEITVNPPFFQRLDEYV